MSSKSASARGGYGQVWHAFDPELQRSVAVKIPRFAGQLSEEQRERFLEEARRLARLTHPGVLPVHDVGVEGSIVYVVTELIDGESLAERIERERPAPIESARLVATVADVLQHAHEQGFVHRDIKPGNILLDAEGRVCLADFGIAQSSCEESEGDVIISGTLPYLSPEQLDDESSSIGPGADLYALGVVLYELLTGQLPYRARDVVELRAQIKKKDPASPRKLNDKVPRVLEKICLKALSRTPENRFASAEEIAITLRRAVGRLELRVRIRRAAQWTVPAAILVGIVVWLALPPAGNEDAANAGGPNRLNDQSVGASRGPADREAERAKPILDDHGGSLIGWLSFEGPRFRSKNHGSMASDFSFVIDGQPTYTVPTDVDAPPPILGDGVRLQDGKPGVRVMASILRPLQIATGWTICLWFRKEPSGNVDHLIYIGEAQGLGDSRVPEFNLYVAADLKLRVVTFLNFRSTSKSIDATVGEIVPGRWHQVTVVWKGEQQAQFNPGRLRVYLDGRRVFEKEQEHLGLALRNSKGALVLGNIRRLHGEENRVRCLKGVIADVQVYSRALEDGDVQQLWRKVANSFAGSEAAGPSSEN